MRNFAWNSAGFGLIEVVIASAVLLIVMLAASSMITNTQRGAASSLKRVDAVQLQTFISNVLNNTTLCTNSFAGTPAPSAAPPDSMAVPTLKFAGQNFDDSGNNLFDNGQIKIQILKYHSVQVIGGVYTVVIRLQVSLQGAGTQAVVGGNLLAPVDFPVVVNVVGPNITTCKANNHMPDPTASADYGGAGGNAWGTVCPLGYAFSGANYRSGAYVDGLRPMCNPTTPGTATYVGGLTGGTSGSPGTFSCPAGSFVSSVSGKAGAYVDQLNFNCTDITTNSATGSSGAFGGGSGGPWSFACPLGKFITEVRGHSAAYIDQISFVCNPP